jgi:hypothetical protein
VATARWYVPCIGAPFDVQVQLGGQSWAIPGQDMAFRTTDNRCLSGVQGGMQNFFVLGDVFLKSPFVHNCERSLTCGGRSLFDLAPRRFRPAGKACRLEQEGGFAVRSM